MSRTYFSSITTIKLVGWALIGATTTALMGCPGECISPIHRFEVTAQISPKTDSLAIGDTLWIESTASTTMRDLRSGQDVDFDNAANFGSTIRVAELQFKSDTLIDAVNRFTILTLLGKAYTIAKLKPARVLQFEYAQIGKQYQLRLGLICRQKGVFGLFISDAASVYQRNKSVCEGASILIKVSNTDKHLHYLQDLYFKTQPVEEAVKQTSYCFLVQ